MHFSGPCLIRSDSFLGLALHPVKDPVHTMLRYGNISANRPLKHFVSAKIQLNYYQIGVLVILI